LLGTRVVARHQPTIEVGSNSGWGGRMRGYNGIEFFGAENFKMKIE